MKEHFEVIVPPVRDTNDTDEYVFFKTAQIHFFDDCQLDDRYQFSIENEAGLIEIVDGFVEREDGSLIKIFTEGADLPIPTIGNPALWKIIEIHQVLESWMPMDEEAYEEFKN